MSDRHVPSARKVQIAAKRPLQRLVALVDQFVGIWVCNRLPRKRKPRCSQYGTGACAALQRKELWRSANPVAYPTPAVPVPAPAAVVGAVIAAVVGPVVIVARREGARDERAGSKPAEEEARATKVTGFCGGGRGDRRNGNRRSGSKSGESFPHGVTSECWGRDTMSTLRRNIH